MRNWALILLLFFPILAKAQFGRPTLDSLLRVLPTKKDDTTKADILSRITADYSRIDAAKGIVTGLQGTALSRRLNWQRGIVANMIDLGLCYTTDAEYEKALACFDTAYTVGEKIDYKEGVLLAFMNEAVVFNDQGNYSRALDFLMRSLKIAEETRDSNHIALNIADIGSVYSKLEDYPKALEYGKQAYAFYKRRNNKTMEAVTLSGLADLYDGLGQRDKSLDAYTEALSLQRDQGDRAGLIVTLANRAITYSEDKNYDPSIRDFSEAVRIADSLKDSYRLASVLNNFAHTYIDAAKAVSVELPGERSYYLQQAGRTLQQALQINQKNGNLDALSDNYKYIAMLDSVTGNYKEALIAYEQYRFYYDSIFTASNQKTIQKLEDQHQIEVRDKQIEINKLELHNQRNQRWFFIGGLLVLFLIGSLLLFQNRQRKKANNKLKLLNVELDEANRAKATLFGIIGHDLRGPVANLINYLHLRNEAPDLTEDGRDRYEKKITAGAHNLLGTMEELLLWGKGQMHNFSPRKEPLAVQDLFAEMRLLYPNNDHLHIEFLDPQSLTLFTDGDYLKTILRNLTTNAIKAVEGQPAGIITWRAWQEDQSARPQPKSAPSGSGARAFLSITDNGRGIPDAGRRVLFEQTATLTGKNGLGLHLVRDFAAAIGVTVNVQTLPEGGTVFVLDM